MRKIIEEKDLMEINNFYYFKVVQQFQTDDYILEEGDEIVAKYTSNNTFQLFDKDKIEDSKEKLSTAYLGTKYFDNFTEYLAFSDKEKTEDINEYYKELRKVIGEVEEYRATITGSIGNETDLEDILTAITVFIVIYFLFFVVAFTVFKEKEYFLGTCISLLPISATAYYIHAIIKSKRINSKFSDFPTYREYKDQLNGK